MNTISILDSYHITWWLLIFTSDLENAYTSPYVNSMQFATQKPQGTCRITSDGRSVCNIWHQMRAKN